ncbi:MAG: peptidylprolyl isomerase [Deltaproteobacteria bacterium]|nr:peptidylprolyl isomerase [Deltaproteobacteria bacterium]
MFYNKNKLEKRAALTLNNFIAVFVLLIITVIASPACSEDEKKSAISGSKVDTSGAGDILAEVNGKTIFTNELLKQYNLYFLISRFSRTSLKDLTINSYLDFYISELLLRSEADAFKASITEDQAKKEKERYLKLFRFPDEAFVKWLDSKSLTMEDAELYFKKILILQKLYIKKFGAKKFSDEEVREYYKVHNEYYNRPAKIALSHILICHQESQGCASDLSKDKAKELAESIRKSLTPEKFAESAKKYSFDSTGQIGGSLGVITKGSAIPSLDKAAFSLKPGEISDPVESEHGYHILYVTNKAEELSIPFEDARESIEYTLEEEHITSELLKYSEQIKKNAKIIKYSETDRKGSLDLKEQANTKKSVPPVKQYSTFKVTGKDIYRNSKGQPVIIMFSHIGCSFCKWIEETFDDTVMDYIKKGLIEAHHYDIQTKDDLLTPETENDIPEQYVKLFNYENPNRSTPSFNFGGMYYRLGAGYFDQDDLYAEEMEMRQIIDDLIRY